MNEFQTTFIPKKPIGETAQAVQPKRQNPSVGIFTMLATLLFVISLIASGGIYFYNQLLTANIATMQESLSTAEGRIEQSFIVELQNLDKRLRNSNQLIAQHVAISPFFRFLEDNTLKSIQYDSFDFSFSEGRPVATITGRARQYRTIAEQSINFGESSLIETHVFSNFTLTQQGQVSFSLKIIPSSDLLFFEKSLGRVIENKFTTPVQVQETMQVIPSAPAPEPAETEGVIIGDTTESTATGENVSPLDSDDQARLPVIISIG